MQKQKQTKDTAYTKDQVRSLVAEVLAEVTVKLSYSWYACYGAFR